MVLKNKGHSYRSKQWDVWNHVNTNPRKRNNQRNILLVQLVRTIVLKCINIYPRICSTPPLDTNINLTSTTNIQPQPTHPHPISSEVLSSGKVASKISSRPDRCFRSTFRPSNSQVRPRWTFVSHWAQHTYQNLSNFEAKAVFIYYTQIGVPCLTDYSMI